jgi:hypothetical protein
VGQEVLTIDLDRLGKRTLKQSDVFQREELNRPFRCLRVASRIGSNALTGHYRQRNESDNSNISVCIHLAVFPLLKLPPILLFWLVSLNSPQETAMCEMKNAEKNEKYACAPDGSS